MPQLLTNRLSPRSNRIAGAVAQYFNISRTELIGRRRTSNTAKARHVFIYLAAQCDRSLGQLAVELDRDHTTLIHSLRKMQSHLDTNDDTAQQIRSIQDHLSNELTFGPRIRNPLHYSARNCQHCQRRTAGSMTTDSITHERLCEICMPAGQFGRQRLLPEPEETYDDDKAHTQSHHRHPEPDPCDADNPNQQRRGQAEDRAPMAALDTRPTGGETAADGLGRPPGMLAEHPAQRPGHRTPPRRDQDQHQRTAAAL